MNLHIHKSQQSKSDSSQNVLRTIPNKSLCKYCVCADLVEVSDITVLPLVGGVKTNRIQTAIENAQDEQHWPEYSCTVVRAGVQCQCLALGY